jgi:mannose-6-phosphate isomerase-like protein (cupin superfamily)
VSDPRPADDPIARISLQGQEREQALRRIHAIVAGWGLKLPATLPDPLHFGYNDFARIGETEFNINNDVEQGYCGKFMFLFEGQTCPMHHHRVKHETFFVVKGKIRMELDGRRLVVNQGDTLVVPQNARHEFSALEDSLVLESSKPDRPDDSIFDDPNINRAIFGVTDP